MVKSIREHTKANEGSARPALRWGVLILLCALVPWAMSRRGKSTGEEVFRDTPTCCDEAGCAQTPIAGRPLKVGPGRWTHWRWVQQTAGSSQELPLPLSALPPSATQEVFSEDISERYLVIHEPPRKRKEARSNFVKKMKKQVSAHRKCIKTNKRSHFKTELDLPSQRNHLAHLMP